MANVLDKLFSILPVVVGLIWTLSRMKKGKEKFPKKIPAAVSSQKEKLLKMAEEFVGQKQTDSIVNIYSSHASWRKNLPGGEVEAEHKPDITATPERRPCVPKYDMPSVEATQVGWQVPAEERQLATEGLLSNASRLSPVAKGMVWSMILDKPVGWKK